MRSRMNVAARCRGLQIWRRRSRPVRVPGRTRAIRANAAIIRPFQAVSTLSSRCGRGRAARASNICTRARFRIAVMSDSAFPNSFASSSIDRAT